MSTLQKPTLDHLLIHLKVSRNMLTKYQNRLNVVNAEIDAEDEESWELNQMRTERTQLRYDIELTEKHIADYLEQLSAKAT